MNNKTHKTIQMYVIHLEEATMQVKYFQNIINIIEIRKESNLNQNKLNKIYDIRILYTIKSNYI